MGLMKRKTGLERVGIYQKADDLLPALKVSKSEREIAKAVSNFQNSKNLLFLL